MPIVVSITADSADELSEPLRKIAKESNGKWVVQGLPEGYAVEDVKGLRSAKQHVQNELNETKSKLGQFQAFLDAGLTPEQAKEAADALGKLKAGQLKGNDEVEAFKKAASEKYASEVAGLKKSLEDRDAELAETMIRSRLAPVIAARGGSESMDAIMTLARQNIRVVPDPATKKLRLVVVASDGAVMTTKKVGSMDPMGEEELIDGMRESPALKGLFQVRQVGGAGSTSQSRGAPQAGNQDSSRLSAKERIIRGHTANA